MRTRELFESERRKRELEESYETKKRYSDEALEEVSVWKKCRSWQLGRPDRQIVMVIRTPSIGCYRYPK
jgi:hypothetical protein